MREVIDFLNTCCVLYLATIGANRRPKVRPFQYMLEKEGKLFFCTSNKKKIYHELSRDPTVDPNVA